MKKLFFDFEWGSTDSLTLVYNYNKLAVYIIRNLQAAFDIGTLIFTDENDDSALYRLQEFDIKSPAEHLLNGIQYDVELQIIHKQYDSEDKLGLSIFFDAKKNVPSCIFKGFKIEDIEMNVWFNGTIIKQ